MRRGIALSIDAAVAMTIAVFGFSFLALSSSNIRPSFDSSAQVQLASADIYRALSQTTLAELEAASPTIAGMHADGTLSDSDMAMTEMALLAKLNWEGTAQSRDYASRIRGLPANRRHSLRITTSVHGDASSRGRSPGERDLHERRSGAVDGKVRYDA